MECIRQLLLRCSEALFLLQLLSQHHLTRLVQNFDANMKLALLQLTFHQLVCSEEGDRLATRFISVLMEVIHLKFRIILFSFFTWRLLVSILHFLQKEV